MFPLKTIASGKEQKIRIEAQSGLKEDDIKRMLKDAELHAEEDKKRKEEVELRNEADSLAFRATKALTEYKDKLPKDVVDDVQSKIDAMKKAIESNDICTHQSRKSRSSKPTCSISAKRWQKQPAPDPLQAACPAANQVKVKPMREKKPSPEEAEATAMSSNSSAKAMTISKKLM